MGGRGRLHLQLVRPGQRGVPEPTAFATRGVVLQIAEPGTGDAGAHADRLIGRAGKLPFPEGLGSPAGEATRLEQVAGGLWQLCTNAGKGTGWTSTSRPQLSPTFLSFGDVSFAPFYDLFLATVAKRITLRWLSEEHGC